jgi:geranylgeranyl reductase family protein
MTPDGSTLHDVCVVGAGPSGSTCAWYLARQGKRVLLLERKEFPRDKLCGDAVCSGAQAHLRRMGVLQEILAEDKGKWAAVGGFVSPSGIRFIGNSAEHTNGSLVIAIKRKVLDEKIARAASRAGAELVEDYDVAGATFDRAAGVWTVHAKAAGKPAYRARALVAADGASSVLARSLGLVHGPADAVCSRSYVRAGTSDFPYDGVVFYPKELLPGYCAIFREAGDDLNFACYVIPGGRCRSRDLRQLHLHLSRHDPEVSQALGTRAELEPVRGAGLRLGGIPQSYSDHLLVLGDAAGQIDPLTGEGIQYAMDAAEIAAQTLAEGFAVGDLRASLLRRYHDRWMAAFGWDFAWSKRLARFLGKHPIFLDAWAEVTRRRGAGFLAEWATVMTGARPKRSFLRPGMGIPILFEAARLCLSRAFRPLPQRVAPEPRLTEITR